MIGVFGGSGFYSFLDKSEVIETETPFGKPSSPITIGKLGEKEVAFIARHGLQHEFPPHRIPYRANMYAFKELGVKRVLAPISVGSLRRHIEPGHFLVPDQFVNFTRRDDTFYEERPVTHISMAEPYCHDLRSLIIETAHLLNLPLHGSGTMVVIEGPRFSSRAESNFYHNQGWDVVNMTQYPEVVLARELEICYASVALITDFDAGIKGDPAIRPVAADDVMRTFSENNEKLKKLIFEVIPKIPEIRQCACRNAIEGSRI
jgi:5'-methylthioadenosine phosphorylase